MILGIIKIHIHDIYSSTHTPGSLPRFVVAGAVPIFGEMPYLWSRRGEGEIVGGSFMTLNVLIRTGELSDVVACEM